MNPARSASIRISSSSNSIWAVGAVLAVAGVCLAIESQELPSRAPQQEDASSLSVAPHGKCVAFDGSGASVRVANSRSLDIAGDLLTVSFWVRVDPSAMSDMALVVKPWAAGSQADPPYQYGVEFGSRSKTADFYFGTEGDVSKGPFSIPLPPGVWTYIAFAYDGSNVYGYRDGVAELKTAVTGKIVARDTPLVFGADPSGAKGFKGELDDVRIYSGALSAAQIGSDMVTGVGIADPITPPGTVTGFRRTDVRATNSTAVPPR